MNLNKRELNEHVEFESQTYYAAFAAELEACAQPMWGLLSHCKVRVRLSVIIHALFMTYFRLLKSERSVLYLCIFSLLCLPNDQLVYSVQ